MGKLKKVVSLLLVVTMLMPVLANANAAGLPFGDVQSQEWYYEAVEYVYKNGLFSGTDRNTFSPNLSMTRGMLVTVLHRAEGEQISSGQSFSDVPAGMYYSEAVAWAASNGIVTGVGGGKFAPDSPVTREQMVVILCRYAEYKGYDTDIFASLDSYTDASYISSWAVDAVKWAVSEGFINGTSATALTPQETATRAQVAAILMRFYQRIEKYLAFKDKDIDDFSGYEIINFDDSDETNFAVLAKETIVAEVGDTVNRLSSSDADRGTYTFENIDDSIRSLAAGDIFYAQDRANPNEYVLVKIDEVHISGSTAVITAGEAEISDIFTYIDIDMDIVLGEESGNVIASDVAALQYNSGSTNFALTSIAQGENRAPAVYTGSVNTQRHYAAASNVWKLSEETQAFSFSLGDGESFEVSGEDKVTATIRIRFDLFGIDEILLTVKQEITASVKGSKTFAEQNFAMETLPYPLPLDGGVGALFSLEVLLQPVCEFSLSGEVSGEYKAVITEGYKYANGKCTKIEDTDADELNLNVDGECNFSIGMNLEISLNALSVLSTGLSGEVGLEFEGKEDNKLLTTNREEKHMCLICVDGEVKLYGELSAFAEVGRGKWKATIFDITLVKVGLPIADFYVSFLNENADFECGWGDCPHKQYLLTVYVLDQDGAPVENASVYAAGESIGTLEVAEEDAGAYSIYLFDGDYTVNVMSGGDILTIPGSVAEVTLNGGKEAVMLYVEKKKVTAPNQKTLISIAYMSAEQMQSVLGNSFTITQYEDGFIHVYNTDNDTFSMDIGPECAILYDTSVTVEGTLSMSMTREEIVSAATRLGYDPVEQQEGAGGDDLTTWYISMTVQGHSVSFYWSNYYYDWDLRRNVLIEGYDPATATPTSAYYAF